MAADWTWEKGIQLTAEPQHPREGGCGVLMIELQRKCALSDTNLCVWRSTPSAVAERVGSGPSRPFGIVPQLSGTSPLAMSAVLVPDCQQADWWRGTGTQDSVWDC